jgi:cold-inducible RNA-binding protein
MQGGPNVPKKLYVGNLAYSVTDEDLRNLFSQSGTVDSVAVISDKFSGQSKGFGFVEMADAGAADAAIKTLDGSELKGRNIKVNEAKPREGGGGGGGRGGDRDRSGGGRGNRW